MNSVNATRVPGRAPSSFGLALLLGPGLTVFFSSACIMVVELVAGRIISRYLGQSLYTWTGIIGVVLAGISLGNYLGGRLADRRWGRGTLAMQFLAAALGCVAMLGLNRLAGEWSALGGLAWPLRISLHLIAAFFVPAMLLGAISPVIAKRALQLGQSTGRTMGSVYAWAIAGSILGTFLTGYYLLMWFGATTVVVAAGSGLGLVGLVYAVGAVMQRGASARSEVTSDDASAPPKEGGRWLSRDAVVAVVTVFLASACVMGMEMVAGRMISRHYGQSLYSWTTVIGVVLAGMTLGSYLGGRLVDRFDDKRTLTHLLVLSSLFCLAVPAANRLASRLALLERLPWVGQIAVHCLFAFFVPAVLLGAVPPVVAKMALASGGPEGRTVGKVYAWGSVGSIVGTFLAGYWLIAALGMVYTECLVAGVLAALALYHGFRNRLAWAWSAVCAIALIGAVVSWMPLRFIGLVLALQQIYPPDVVYVDESQYSHIMIVADAENRDLRRMRLDRLIHSRVDLSQPLDLRYDYEWIYEGVLDAYMPKPDAVRAMVIGGGGYTFPRYLELTRPGSRIDVSEIDPAVTEAAFEAFGLPRDTGLEIFNMDARNHIDDLLAEEGGGGFDLIFGDSINDYSVPYHLTTVEFNERLASLLTDDGLYMLNLIDMMSSGKFLGSVVKTCRETFPYVYVFASSKDHPTRETFVVINAKRPLDLDAVPDAIRARHDYLGYLMSAAEIDELMGRPGVCVLTDDFAPVDNMLAPVVRVSQHSGYFLRRDIESADILLEQGRYDDAIAACHDAIARNPGSAEAYEVLGVSLKRKGQVDEAIAALDKAIELRPDNAWAHHYLARALLAKGDLNSAAASWKKALEINPEFATAYQDLGAALIQGGAPEQAIVALEKALQLVPHSTSAHTNLAVALFARGDMGGAVEHLERVLAIDPKAPGIYPQLAIAYWRMKDYDKAWDAVAKSEKRREPIDRGFLEALQRDSGRSAGR